MDQVRIELASKSSPSVDITLLDLHPRSAFRPVSWRWAAASLLAQPGCRSRRPWFDEPVRRAARFLRVAARLGRDDHPRLTRRDPELAAAVAVHVLPARRLAVEARVLAGLPVEEVASRCGLPVDVVALFEALFFDARPRLGHTDNVLFTAIDPSGAMWAGTPSIESVVRLLAYRGGEHVAEAALDVLSGGGANDVAENPQGSMRRLRMVTDLLRLPITARTAPLLMRTYVFRAEVERRRAARRVAVVTGPVYTFDFCARDASNWSFLNTEVRANGTPEGPSASAVQPSETTPASIAASDSRSVRAAPARRTA